jgi:putative transposase
MIDRTHALPIVRQAKALNISRGSVYYKPRPVSAEDLEVDPIRGTIGART